MAWPGQVLQVVPWYCVIRVSGTVTRAVIIAWDVTGTSWEIRVGLIRARVPTVTNPLGLDNVKESALSGT